MTGRSYLSIGDVLTLLREEFPDVTISKIRFLESQGLVDPERSASGYRKFYERDVERLRWVLRQQREHFLPLKVIRDRLAAAGNGVPDDDLDEPALAGAVGEGRAHQAAGDAGGSVSGGLSWIAGERERLAALAVEPRPGTGAVPIGEGPTPAVAAGDGLPGLDRTGAPAPSGEQAPDEPGPGPRDEIAEEEPVPDPAAPPFVAPAHAAGAQPGARDGLSEPAAPAVAPTTGAAGPATGGAAAAAAAQPAAPVHARAPGAGEVLSPAVSGVSLTLDELCTAAGLTPALVSSLESFGLLAPMVVAGVAYYDEEALTVAKLVTEFGRYGIEPRHLRLYRNAVDREAGLVEQVVTPLLRQRNPEARQRAVDAAGDLARLGQGLRAALVRTALRRQLGS